MGDENKIRLILLALLVSIIPQLIDLPVWVAVLFLVLWMYRFFSARLGLKLPGRRMKNLIATAGIILVVAGFGAEVSRRAAVSLLVIMAAVKPYEIESYRDRMVSLFLSYFLVMTSILFSTHLLMAAYMGVALIFDTSVLIAIHRQQSSFINDIRLSTKMIIAGLPLAILLFLVFPRFGGSLGGFVSKGSVTGFTDVLAAGSVSRIVQSSEVAFRVQFDEGIPPKERLYWRGVVFDHFDGSSWRHDPNIQSAGRIRSFSEKVRYDVVMEPHGKKWLFALDIPVKTDARARLRGDYTLVAPFNIKRQVRYRAESVIDALTDDPGFIAYSMTRLPYRGNQRSRRLAREIRNKAQTVGDAVDLLLAYFKEHGFEYSLNPPPLSGDPIDSFLFETKRGYCGHFASAFAFVMRAAGIPARIVGGYQGGEINPLGNYVIVRQSDAHAWVELYMPQQGWRRVDPTVAVLPERIEAGSAAVLPAERIMGLWNHPFLRPAYPYYKRLSFYADYAEHLWTRQVIGYSFSDQKGIFSRLGIYLSNAGTYLALAAMLAGVIAGAFFYFLYLARPPRAHAKDPVLETYRRFLAKMARAGLKKPSYFGPVEYSTWVRLNRPLIWDEVERITDLYVRLRYAPGSDRRLIAEFKRRVRRFKL